MDSVELRISNALLNIMHCRGYNHRSSVAQMLKDILDTLDSDSDESLLQAVISYHDQLHKGQND